MTPPIAAAIATRVDRPFDRCPRCSGMCLREPGASRCLLCGRVWYINGAGAEQKRFEESSGLIARPAFDLSVVNLRARRLRGLRVPGDH